jgi:hypothetical protein
MPPSPETPASDLPDAPISLEQFVAELLPEWADADPIAADSHVSTPRAAAIHALYRAGLADGKGKVLIIAPQGDHKTITGFIEAMIESQPMLRGIDTCIEVATPERAPLVRDVTHTIELVPPRMTEPIDTRDLARTILFCTKDDPRLASKIERIMGVEPGALAACHASIAARAAEKFAEFKAMGPVMPKPEPIVPNVNHGAPADGLQDWERDALFDMDRRESNVVRLANRREPQVIRRRPR